VSRGARSNRQPYRDFARAPYGSGQFRRHAGCRIPGPRSECGEARALYSPPDALKVAREHSDRRVVRFSAGRGDRALGGDGGMAGAGGKSGQCCRLAMRGRRRRAPEWARAGDAISPGGAPRSAPAAPRSIRWPRPGCPRKTPAPPTNVCRPATSRPGFSFQPNPTFSHA